MSKKLIVVGLFLAAAVLTFGISNTAAVHGKPVPAPQVGACGCNKTAPVCCLDCNGQFAFCARSHAFCPECPAP